jgi:putative transcriptional regulator
MIKFTLDKVLEEKGLTKYWLSKQTNIDNNTLAKIYNNESKQVKLDTLNKICLILNCDINDILKFEVDIPSLSKFITEDELNKIIKD